MQSFASRSARLVSLTWGGIYVIGGAPLVLTFEAAPLTLGLVLVVGGATFGWRRGSASLEFDDEGVIWSNGLRTHEARWPDVESLIVKRSQWSVVKGVAMYVKVSERRRAIRLAATHWARPAELLALVRILGSIVPPTVRVEARSVAYSRAADRQARRDLEASHDA